MNTTKRKFDTSLSNNTTSTSISSPSNDSLTKVPSTTTSTSVDIETEVQKRRRISDRFIDLSRVVKPLNATIRSSAAVTQHKKSNSLATPATPQATPRYAPWDREAFLNRLKSFSSLTDWTPKPARVNEVEWAKRGWVCQKKERVRCCLCNVEILVKLNKKEVDGKEEDVYVAQNIEDALVDKYVELIVESHEENCLWKQRGCDDTIFKMSLNHAPDTLHALRTRYDELVSRKDTLPYQHNIRAPESFVYEDVTACLPKEFFSAKSDTADAPVDASTSRVAFTMALFGWQGHSHERLGSQLGSVSCRACFRVLGLWLFKSKEVNEAGEEVVGATVNSLDVVSEHREYCPWRNSISQSGANSVSGSLAAWEVVTRVIKNSHYLRTQTEKSAVKPRGPRPTTPQKQVTSDNFEEVDDADAKSIRDEEDKKRWARLRRVKSMFNSRPKKESDKGAPAKN